MNIPYGKQFITEEDIKSVVDALNSDYLTQGPLVQEFENEFAKYVDAKYAVAVSNGTAALHLCALALGVSKGINVITTSITFAASANCIKYCKGEVYFVDINSETILFDITLVEKLILEKPKNFFKGIVAVDFAGLPINLEELRELADKYNLWIIEDACHSPGGYFVDSKKNIQKCGNGAFADLSIFSFHPVKHIACGEGGMITTNNFNLYEQLIKLRSHGITKNKEQFIETNQGEWYYEMQDLGYNYRFTEMQSALGLSQLKRADQGISRRQFIAKKYTTELAKIPNQKVKYFKFIEGHAYHLYIIQIQERRELYDFLKSKGIFTQVHYIPVHTMPYYRGLGWKRGDLPKAEKYYEQCLSLPIFYSLTDKELDYVIDSIKLFYK